MLNEVKILQHLSEVAQGDDHPGMDFTRLANDVFTIEGQSGPHYCIVAQPQGSSLRTLQEVLPDSRLPKILVKPVLTRLLFSINWLHFDCDVVHTGTLDKGVLFENIH